MFEIDFHFGTYLLTYMAFFMAVINYVMFMDFGVLQNALVYLLRVSTYLPNLYSGNL